MSDFLYAFFTLHNGARVQQKACEEIYHGYGYYSSRPTSDCSREVSVSNAIGGKCYVIGCTAIGRKNNYYNDNLVCSQGKGNGFFVGPLYNGFYCALPSSSGGGGGGGLGHEYGWFNVGTTNYEGGLSRCDCTDPTLYGCETAGDVCILGNSYYDSRDPNVGKYIKFECRYGYFSENGVTPPADICGKK